MDIFKNVPKGLVIEVFIYNGDVYFNSDYGYIKIGTISMEDYSWSGDIEPKNGKCSAVVLDCDEEGYIVFGVKHLTSVEEYVASLSSDKIVDVFYEWIDLKNQVMRLENDLKANL